MTAILSKGVTIGVDMAVRVGGGGRLFDCATLADAADFLLEGEGAYKDARDLLNFLAGCGEVCSVSDVSGASPLSDSIQVDVCLTFRGQSDRGVDLNILE